ncbi:Glycoside-Pentoside-Hexuronide family transporter [Phytophthora megakarya]|uniref:Glycoside-Pentoside-Hexuronide family transporter n=1 Tax=Phytophthora megakarya TaxID=4795 RepID=A0A225VWD2_9STRA|nr:Glycoside-Pentoside-Hexuronide family transporter [Phytophthora megakarya]
MPRMVIRMASAAQWAALGPYLQTMLPRYAVQLTQLSGPLCGVLVGPIVGVYSDRNTSKFGRRRPYLVVSAVGSIICWILMGYTRELGDALGDVGSGKPGEVTDRKWTALLTVLFYFWTGFNIHLARTPAMLLISDFAGRRQTVGAALGQGWSVLGAVIVAVYTQCFGAAYNSLPWFMGMLSAFMAVSVGAACYVAKETPLEKKTMDKRSCCQNATSAFLSIFDTVRNLPKVLVAYCVVHFFIQYAFAAYNGNKGMFFGIEVFDGDAANVATCGAGCSEAQLDYNRGVKLAGGLADILFCVVGYLFSWVLPPLVRRYGAQYVAALSIVPQILLMVMAFCDVVALDVTIVAFTSITTGTFFAMIVPLVVHVRGDTNNIGVQVGVLTSVSSAGQLLNFIVGSALVETSLGFKLPIFVGGAVSLLAFFVCIFFFRVKMYSM